jgi:hypothetical protein
MPQPYPKDHPIYTHKPVPPMLYPSHRNDVRYNHKFESFPRRHYVPDLKVRLHNFYEFYEVMHSNQWNDGDLDYQLADPMESNHYIQGRSPFAVLFGAAFLIVWCVCI